jgi:hypothetical protein
LENWFLVLTVRSKDLQRSREAIYTPLLKDLKTLEAGVAFCDGMLKAGVVAHLADNLEAHLVAGLSCNFASRDICRLCHLQVQELLSINSKCGIFCNLFFNCF